VQDALRTDGAVPRAAGDHHQERFLVGALCELSPQGKKR
jgi:hypothetical protein